MSERYGDNEDFSWGGAMFRASMRQCDDCYSEAPLEWWGEHIRICEACREKRVAAALALSLTETEGEDR